VYLPDQEGKSAMLDIVVLAAGQGTRMKSSLPKVLHPIGGKPMLGHVLDSARQLGDAKIHLVVGHGSERVQESFAAADVDFVSQTEQLGTGHAVQQALPVLRQNSTVLILYGDVPLTPSSLLKQLVDCVSEDSMGLLTVNLKDPTGYGRIIRNDQHDVVAIVEQKDATEEQLVIREGNTGMMAVASEDLKRWLPALSAENAQGEY
jgi:bifunctional UDP-N-acetylglucosamine pyrophosphorylase/glucosamine-1-phosphate N-acetyltransferase